MSRKKYLPWAVNALTEALHQQHPLCGFSGGADGIATHGQKGTQIADDQVQMIHSVSSFACICRTGQIPDSIFVIIAQKKVFVGIFLSGFFERTGV